MPEDSPILAYEPAAPRLRRLRPILVLFFCHCVACYAVAAGAFLFNLAAGRLPVSRTDHWFLHVLFHWFPQAPVDFPRSMGAYFIAMLKGNVGWQPTAVLWTAMYAVLFAAACIRLMRRRALT